MSRINKLLLLTIAILLVTACGQRGPLYLPEPDTQPSTTEEQGENNEENSGT